MVNLKLLLGVVFGAGALLVVSSLFVHTVKTVEPSIVIQAPGTPEAPKVNLTPQPVPSTAPTAPAGTSSSKEITPLNLQEDQIVLLNDAIFENAANIAEEIKTKSKKNKEVYLLINSPGGSVLDGAMIISAMEASKVPVNTVCLSLCASMAFVLHQFGHTRMAVDRSFLMAHPAAGGVAGTLEQMQSRLGAVSSFINKMNSYISSRAGISLDAFKQLYMPEMWLDAEDAQKKHFNDKLVSVNIIENKPNQKSLVSKRSLKNEVLYIITKNKVNVTW